MRYDQKRSKTREEERRRKKKKNENGAASPLKLMPRRRCKEEPIRKQERERERERESGEVAQRLSTSASLTTATLSIASEEFLRLFQTSSNFPRERDQEA